MLVSIVIPNYFLNKPGKIVPDDDEQKWFAEICFQRIRRFTRVPYELILIDNGCIHGHELLKKQADVLIVNKENQGFAKACNQGFRKAKGDWICCMNNDIFIWEGWLEALLKTFEDNSNCGAAMPALMKQTKNGKEALTMELDLSSNYDKYGPGAEFGSCWLIKKEIMDKVGLFDENFKCGFGEDRDYWKRIRKAGYETYRTHRTRVFHQGNRTMGNIPDRKKYTIPNREYLRRKVQLEEDLNRDLTEDEKKELRNKVEEDFENGVFKS